MFITMNAMTTVTEAGSVWMLTSCTADIFTGRMGSLADVLLFLWQCYHFVVLGGYLIPMLAAGGEVSALQNMHTFFSVRAGDGARGINMICYAAV